jgi:hypothetical protein
VYVFALDEFWLNVSNILDLLENNLQIAWIIQTLTS